MVPFFFSGDGSIAKGKEDLSWMELLWLTVKMAGLAAVPLLVADLCRVATPWLEQRRRPWLRQRREQLTNSGGCLCIQSREGAVAGSFGSERRKAKRKKWVAGCEKENRFWFWFWVNGCRGKMKWPRGGGGPE